MKTAFTGRKPRTPARRADRRSLRPELTNLEDRLVLSASGGPIGGGIVNALNTQGYQFSNWPAEALQGIQLGATNTQPIVGPFGQSIRAADWVVRDPYPVTNLDGTLAQIDGWYVVAGLASARNDPVGTLREVGYIISKDGVNWQEGGTLIAAGQPGIEGDQLFSGDLRYDASANKLHIFYTAVEGSGPAEFVQSPSGLHMRQEIAISEATPVSTATGLTFTNFVHQGITLRPDGDWYVKPEEANTETEVYGFRDPWIFQDPEGGGTYMLFVANWGQDQKVGVGSTGDAQFPDAGPQNVDPNLPRNDGAVGIARATDATLRNWELMPPIFGAIGVNEQLELPHFVHQDGKYYLFLDTHNRTFIGDLKYDYPEGLYGFVSETMQGPYRPVNGTGLVLANPPVDPLQNYAWKVVPTAPGEAMVMSFINKGNSSTISPTLKLRIQGDSVTIADLQASTAANFESDPGLPFAFGLTPTAPRNSVPPSVVAGVEPGSDTGSSNRDGITKNNRPTFIGTALVGSTVRLYVLANGEGQPIPIGVGTTNANGWWQITSDRALPDGRHKFFAKAEGFRAAPVGPISAQAFGFGTTGPAYAPVTSSLGSLTIDTAGPEVSSFNYDPFSRQFRVGITPSLSGLDPASLSRPDSFGLTRFLGFNDRFSRPVPLGTPLVLPPLSPGAGPYQVNYSLSPTQRLTPGNYGFNVGTSGITDIAGNNLRFNPAPGFGSDATGARFQFNNRTGLGNYSPITLGVGVPGFPGTSPGFNTPGLGPTTPGVTFPGTTTPLGGRLTTSPFARLLAQRSAMTRNLPAAPASAPATRTPAPALSPLTGLLARREALMTRFPAYFARLATR
jgi:levansucrase